MLTPEQEKSRRDTITAIGGMLFLSLLVWFAFNAGPFFETVSTINRVARVAPTIGRSASDMINEYHQEMKQRETLSLADAHQGDG